jgi:hypothetical protein
MSRLVVSLSIAALGLAAITSTACTHHTTVLVRPAEDVVFDAKCIDTECEVGRRAAARSKACQDCIGAWADGCAYDPLCPDADQICAHECATEKCYGPSACVEYTWTAQIEHVSATPGVEEACQKAYADHDARCGVQLTEDRAAIRDTECAQAALADTDAAVPYYECLGASECGKIPSCEKPSSFGAELCAMPSGSCVSSCHDPGHGSLDGLGSLLKPALLDAAQTCMKETSCDEVNRCMDAWRKLFEL